MDNVQKQQIKELLKRFTEQYPSQKKAVMALRSVSEATVINILKNNWENVSDSMFRAVGKQVGMTSHGRWKFVPIRNSVSLATVFDDARKHGNVFAVTAPPGSGKTRTSQWYCSITDNVVHVECAEYLRKKDFLRLILLQLGREDTGNNVNDMMESIEEMVMKLEEPLIIIDEVDKLNDVVLYFFITLYNRLRDKCGIVLLSTNYFKDRVERGIRLRKKGYPEIYSRIGRNFVGLPGINMQEVSVICRENGIDGEQNITPIYNEFEGDIRRVERAVHKQRLLAERKPAQNPLKNAHVKSEPITA